jgi:hypothetical protein
MAKASAKHKPKAPSRAEPSTRRAATRRPVEAAAEAALKTVKAKPKGRSNADTAPTQTFVANHFKPGDFKQGLRSYAQYRDLGIAAATNGKAVAHVIKLIPPCVPAEVSKRHYHDVEFQMIYVLKGWMKGEYDGAGVVTMREGSCWLQPPRIKHTVLDYSDDCELLEVILPADFDTVET